MVKPDCIGQIAELPTSTPWKSGRQPGKPVFSNRDPTGPVALPRRITRQESRFIGLAEDRRTIECGYSNSGGSLAAYYMAVQLQCEADWIVGTKLLTLVASRYRQPLLKHWFVRQPQLRM